MRECVRESVFVCERECVCRKPDLISLAFHNVLPTNGKKRSKILPWRSDSGQQSKASR